MPPKSKFTREEIIEAAFAIVKENGPSALTARALGARLDSSARPIFTVFQSMDEVQQEVILSAKTLYKEYIKKGLSSTPAFKGVGTQYILFSVQEPELFQLLFMTAQDHPPSISGILPLIDDSYEEILLSIQKGYGVDQPSAERLYHHLWIYTHGIATLCATKMCFFTGEEISSMMTEVLWGLLNNMKAGKSND